MRKFYSAMLSLLALAAASCSGKSETVIPDSTVSATPATLNLGAERGAAAEVTIVSANGWTLSGTSDDTFSAVPVAGGAGTTVVTVTALADNTGRQRRVLGSLSVVETSGARYDIPVTQAQQEAEQSLLVVLTGTGNLSSYFTKNINETVVGAAEARLSGGRIVIFRQASASTAYLLEAYCDAQSGAGQLDTLRRYDEPLCSTDEATLVRLLGDMAEAAPARRYGLIMGSHATAWVPSAYLSISRAAVGAQSADSYWQPAPGADLTRWYGYDQSKAMDIATLADVIGQTGISFDYLLFDACFMSSVETLYTLRDAARYIIASPCEIMAYGFPYHLLVQALFDADGMYDLQACCEAFHNYYATTETTRQSGCIALTVSDELEALAEVMKRINAAGVREYDPALLQTYEGLTPHLFFDLRQYVEAACGDAALLDEFLAQFDRTFPESCRLHTPQFYSTYTPSGQMIDIDYYSGVTISEPSEKYVEENRETDWYRATH